MDSIKVRGVNSAAYWHEFGKWEDKSTVSFRAGLEGDMFYFRYDVTAHQLTCYEEKCDELQMAEVANGTIKPVIAPKPWPAEAARTTVR